MRVVVLLTVLLVPVSAWAQAPQSPGFVERAKGAYERLFTKPVRISLESIAPGAGLTAGVGWQPKPWRTETRLMIPSARAAVSQHKYWALDGSLAVQGTGEHEWRVEPYVRLRRMTRLNYFGIGNDSAEDRRADFSMSDHQAGATGYYRPVGWLALGGRGAGLWPRTGSGENPDIPSIEMQFDPAQSPGLTDPTNYLYVGGFVNLNYPYVRSERPRRGGDYMVSFGSFHDTSGTQHSFTRLEIEGQERFTVLGNDRALSIHGRLSSSMAGSGNSVPFYLMDTLGGADNLRGFKESIIGGDETTSTLRSFESFRFRDRATALVQVDFRQRLWSQVWVSVFADAGAVAPRVRDLSSQRLRRGVGVGLSVFRANALAVRAEFSLWGGEGHPHYFTTGRGLNF
jgi:hypothetical protein